MFGDGVSVEWEIKFYPHLQISFGETISSILHLQILKRDNPD
jgi:hypothetical protein